MGNWMCQYKISRSLYKTVTFSPGMYFYTYNHDETMYKKIKNFKTVFSEI